MKQSLTMTLSVWIARVLFTVLAIFLLLSWGLAEFGVSRGNVVAGLEVHCFFLGLSSFCLLGLAFTFRFMGRRKIWAGVILLSLFSCVWFSFSLMMTKIMPTWLWLVLSGLWFALPVAVAVTLIGDGRRTYAARVWIAVGLFVVLNTSILFAASRSLKISRHKFPLGAIETWVTHRYGLNRFRYDFMIWSLAGGPPHDLDGKPHRQALLDLGYFQQKTFNLHRAPYHEVVHQARRGSFTDSLWLIEPSQDKRSFKLTAYNGDMSLWEKIVQEADAGP